MMDRLDDLVYRMEEQANECIDYILIDQCYNIAKMEIIRNSLSEPCLALPAGIAYCSGAHSGHCILSL